MKRATIESLEEGEMILGSNPVGRYMVTEFLREGSCLISYGVCASIIPSIT